MPSFLDDLPGIRDLQWEDGPLLPRRNRLSFVGAVTVADNPALGTTDITFTAGLPAGDTNTYHLGAAIESGLGGEGSPATVPSMATTSLFRLIADVASVSIHGISPDLMPRLFIMNASTGVESIVLVHEGVSADSADMRIACPDLADFTLGPNSIVQLVRDTVSSRWRVVL